MNPVIISLLKKSVSRLNGIVGNVLKGGQSIPPYHYKGISIPLANFIKNRGFGSEVTPNIVVVTDSGYAQYMADFDTPFSEVKDVRSQLPFVVEMTTAGKEHSIYPEYALYPTYSGFLKGLFRDILNGMVSYIDWDFDFDDNTKKLKTLEYVDVVLNRKDLVKFLKKQDKHGITALLVRYDGSNIYLVSDQEDNLGSMNVASFEPVELYATEATSLFSNSHCILSELEMLKDGTHPNLK